MPNVHGNNLDRAAARVVQRFEAQMRRIREAARVAVERNDFARPAAPNVKRFTPAEDALIRKAYRRRPIETLVERLGRSACALRARAQRLGICPSRSWTDAEKALVREMEAAGVPPHEMVARLPGRTLSGVYQIRIKLGLARSIKQKLAGLEDLVREKHAEQWSDSEIVDEWNRRQTDDRVRITREAVSKRRRKMGLSANDRCDRYRQRVAAKTREQLAAAGLPSLAALHRKVIQDRIRAQGWPEDLRWREAQILSLIWERGPMSKREIAEALQMPVHRQSRKMLKSNDAGGNYLATLMRRGLLISMGRCIKTGRGKGQHAVLYSLPLDIQRKQVA